MMDSEKHRQYTGVPNSQILANISMVSEMELPFWIRIPLIEGVNADEENIRATAQFLAALPMKPEMVNLLVYHDVGKGKHARLGTTYNPEGFRMSTPSEDVQQYVVHILQEHGLNAKIGG
jgi:pyruvate formate lyase activating enzyme